MRRKKHGSQYRCHPPVFCAHVFDLYVYADLNGSCKTVIRVLVQRHVCVPEAGVISTGVYKNDISIWGGGVGGTFT